MKDSLLHFTFVAPVLLQFESLLDVSELETTPWSGKGMGHSGSSWCAALRGCSRALCNAPGKDRGMETVVSRPGTRGGHLGPFCLSAISVPPVKAGVRRSRVPFQCYQRVC